MLAPERAHHAQLGESRITTEHCDQTVEFALRQAVLGDQRRRNQRITGARFDFGHQAATRARMDSRRRAPSLEPSKALQARSGCGIRPSTLPSSLMMPAMLRSDPFGFASALGFPLASAYLKITLPSASSSSRISLGATKRPSPWVT